MFAPEGSCSCRDAEDMLGPGGRGRGCLFSTGSRSVKIRKHLVILLMSFVALSDHTQRASTVNNGGKCNYSQSNYSSQLCFAWRMTLKQRRQRDGAPCRCLSSDSTWKLFTIPVVSWPLLCYATFLYWCVFKVLCIRLCTGYFLPAGLHIIPLLPGRENNNWLEHKHLMGRVQRRVAVAVQLVQSSSLSK